MNVRVIDFPIIPRVIDNHNCNISMKEVSHMLGDLKLDGWLSNACLLSYSNAGLSTDIFLTFIIHPFGHLDHLISRVIDFLVISRVIDPPVVSRDIVSPTILRVIDFPTILRVIVFPC